MAMSVHHHGHVVRIHHRLCIAVMLAAHVGCVMHVLGHEVLVVFGPGSVLLVPNNSTLTRLVFVSAAPLYRVLTAADLRWRETQIDGLTCGRVEVLQVKARPARTLIMLLRHPKSPLLLLSILRRVTLFLSFSLFSR